MSDFDASKAAYSGQLAHHGHLIGDGTEDFEGRIRPGAVIRPFLCQLNKNINMMPLHEVTSSEAAKNGLGPQSKQKCFEPPSKGGLAKKYLY